MAIPILRAKISPPELRQDHLPRPALVHKLNGYQHKKLTTLIATAGYGKSSLLAEWARALPESTRCTWYNLDAGDHDPVTFFSYLSTALQVHWPGFGSRLEGMLKSPATLEPQKTVNELLSELESIIKDQSLVLILDDYYLLDDHTQIDPLLSHLLANLPPAIHLVVTSRQPLPFAIARLRSQDQLLEINQDDLRFTPEAARQLFALFAPTAPVQELIQQAEGWITGLQLIRQVYLQAQPGEFEQIITRAPEWLRGIFDYLAEEVFERQPALLQEFLLQSSILDTLVPADCDAIFERSDSAEWLAYLVSHGLYTILLARSPETYRYHHLLADFLRQKLSQEITPAQIQAWHTRAAAHYQAAQRWSDAFHHAIQVSQALAAPVVLQAAPTMRFNGQYSTLQSWLDQFSAEAYPSYPYLYSWQGFIWADHGQYERALGAFQQTISSAEIIQDDRSLYSGWIGLGIVHQRLGDLAGSIQAWEKAVSYAETRGVVAERATALSGLALTHMYSGQNSQALDIFRRGLELAAMLGKPMYSQMMHNIGNTLSYLGEFNQSLHWCEEALKLREEANLKPGIANSSNNIGRLKSLTGDLDSAEQYFKRSIDVFREINNTSGYSYALSNLGEVVEARRGDLAQAEELYRQSIALKEQQHDTLGLQHTWALLSELRRRQGDYHGAEECARQTLQEGENITSLNENLLLQVALTLAWLSGGQVSLAEEALNRLIEQHRSLTNNHYELARCLWYQAQAQFQLGQDGLPALAEALALAERWEYHFLVSKLAQELPQLLAHAVADDLQPAFVTRILSGLGDAAVPVLSGLLSDADPTVRQRAIQRLAELGTHGVWTPLWQAAEQDQDAAVKAQAKAALARLGAATPPPLRVTTLGRFTLRVGERQVTAAAWGSSRKAQSVFKILLAQAGQQVSRGVMIEMLWPGTPHEDLDNVKHTLNQAISALRKVLEPYLPPHYPSRYIFSDNETCCVQLPPGSWVDDKAFEDALRQAKEALRRGDPEGTLRHYQAALELYKGDYLVEESRLDWPLARQDLLKQQSLEPLEALARLHLDQNDPQRAAEFALRLNNTDTYYDTGYLLLMRAQVALGQLKETLRTYKSYLKNCVEEMGFPLDPEIHRLYLWILEQLKKKG